MGGAVWLTYWSVQIDKIQVARDQQLELFVTVKNVGGNRYGLRAGELDWRVTDEDGVTLRAIGNLYRASGNPDLEPALVPQTLFLEPGEQAKVRFLFNIPRGNPPFTKLSVKDVDGKTHSYTMPALTLPQ